MRIISDAARGEAFDFDENAVGGLVDHLPDLLSALLET